MSECGENWVLIGFMGSGKSTVGRLCAEFSGRYFLDVDDLIESRQAQTVCQIFDTRGEARFREYEREAGMWISRCVRGSVIATGGGMAVNFDAVGKMGRVIYLQVPFETVMDRIGNTGARNRPLFNRNIDIAELYRQRKNRYEALCDLKIDASKDPRTVARTILEALGEHPAEASLKPV